MTHILVTNDDGVFSPGLLALKRALDGVGEVSVIAPDRNRSAIGRGITVHDPLHVEQVELEDGTVAYATDGTPVDCVRFAVLGLVGSVPDVVVSGINMGVNLGDDVTYSGTVAAALEGVLLGWPAIAVSQQHSGPPDERWEARYYDYSAVCEFVPLLLPLITEHRLPRSVLLNVNAPAVPAERPAKARVTRLGRRIYYDQLTVDGTDGPRTRYTIYGEPPGHHPEPGTDFAAIDDGEISVSPLHFELTDEQGMEPLRALMSDLGVGRGGSAA
jgi:5'-nucleotidase